jgi:hypothetical protein
MAPSIQTESTGDPDLIRINNDRGKNHVQHRNMAGFKAPRLDTVRVGVIGMGRGDNHIKALVQIEGVEITAICDNDPVEIEKSMVWFKDTEVLICEWIGI